MNTEQTPDEIEATRELLEKDSLDNDSEDALDCATELVTLEFFDDEEDYEERIGELHYNTPLTEIFPS